MNFRRILSKTSLRSSSSSGKVAHIEEVTKLKGEIDSLKQTIEALKNTLESREAAIGTIAREKEKLYVELKSVQRTNRNLQQELVDERDIHSKEKEFLINELKRLSKRQVNENTTEQSHNIQEVQSTSILHEQIKTKDEVIFKIGAKFMKMRSSKMILQKKLERLRGHNKKICERVILLLRDNRKTLNILLHQILNTPTIPPSSRKYLKLLKINANLHYENTQLKVYLSSQLKADSFNDNEDKHCKRCSYYEKQPITTMISSEKTPLMLENPRKQHHPVHTKIKSNYLRSREKRLPRFGYMDNSFAIICGEHFKSVSDPCLAKVVGLNSKK